MEIEHHVHMIPPLFDEASKILILGSFPSVKSREAYFFYGHPQNRFWKVMANILNERVPETVDSKKQMMLKHHIAMWDVIASCDIIGSSDSSITNAVANDLSTILNNSQVKHIFVNGKTANKLYAKYIEPQIGIEAQCLPSTSPANAAWKLEKLVEEWGRIKSFL